MRSAKYKAEVDTLLERDGIITVNDFVSACPGMPKSSVYARIRSLERSNRIQVVGKGRYTSMRSNRYTVQLTPEMLAVNTLLISECQGINHCISQLGNNLLVEVPKETLPHVLSVLQARYDKVAVRSDLVKVLDKLEDWIIVSNLVSEAPLMEVEGVTVPSLEKSMVDTLCDHQDPISFKKVFDIYPVNLNKLNRYAARRGVSAELEQNLASLQEDRIKMFAKVRQYLTSIPVTKAWVFGSFARMEETKDSDLDLIVCYDKEAAISLLTIIRWKLDLEKLTGREVDLVEDGYLKPFAISSANRDKYLIYERAS